MPMLNSLKLLILKCKGQDKIDNIIFNISFPSWEDHLEWLRFLFLLHHDHDAVVGISARRGVNCDKILNMLWVLCLLRTLIGNHDIIDNMTYWHTSMSGPHQCIFSPSPAHSPSHWRQSPSQSRHRARPRHPAPSRRHSQDPRMRVRRNNSTNY